jgi:flagellum-specific peptidoglycan hydrolase FlgJ
MTTASKPWWQQATALVSLSASGTITGFSVTPHSPADMPKASPAQIRLLALRQMAKPASTAEVTFRSAIVDAAKYYLRLAQHNTPAEMEALIWEHDSRNGVDHGESCAAFASLTLELASRVVGRDSWVTGGTSYPWPLHEWADVRVDPNPASPGIVSVQQDAQAHGRWHPLGDGYTPQPGDWVLFDGHVEVVTGYSSGVLSTIGGDSLPNFSVNAHQYTGSLAADGVAGFVDNDEQAPAAGAAGSAGHAAANPVSADAAQDGAGSERTNQAAAGSAAIPGLTAHPDTRTAPIPAQSHGHRRGPRPAAARPKPTKAHPHRSGRSQGFAAAGADVRTEADVPGAVRFGPAAEFQKATRGAASIPGASEQAGGALAKPDAPHHRFQPPADAAPVQLSSAQRAFIATVAPGALAAQRQYGVPASVTIAQAIDESGWGQSGLATKAHNLFGMKGNGPAGSDTQLTEEYEDGHWQVTIASFRAYHDVAQSIEDHGKLLATSGYYQAAMARSDDPDAFASALTGVYATDPQYGQTLISLMRQYNLYEYNHQAPAKTVTPDTSSASPGPARPAKPGTASIPGAAAASGPGSRSAGGQGTAGHGTTGRGTTGQGTTGHGGRPLRGAPGPGTTSPGRGSTSPGRRGTAPARSPWPGSAAPPAAPIASASTPSSSLAPAAAPPIAPPSASTSVPVRAKPPATTPRTRPSKARRSGSQDKAATATLLVKQTPAPHVRQARTPAVRTPAPRYDVPLPRVVKNSFVAVARTPILRSESLYQDVAGEFGLPWELLAACDWMQCESKPRHSPVHGERLGTRNHDGTVYHTKSQALAQCAEDLTSLADQVYGIDLTSRKCLSIRDLANVYAAFRWGALLRTHKTSAMEFPYSVAGLTVYKINMRWPGIDEPSAPDKPGSRFKRPFGAVPVVLALDYPATAPPGQA